MNGFLKKYIFNIILLILSIILYCIPFIIAPVCTISNNGMYMSCYHSGILVRNIATVLIILNIISIFIKNKFKFIFNFIVIVLSLLVHLIPHKILKIKFGYNIMKNTPRFYGFCSKDVMHCVHNKTFFWTSVIVGFIIVITILSIVYSMLKKEEING